MFTGGTFSNRIGKGTSVLVAADTTKVSSKLKQAKQQGVDVWNEDMWIDVVRNNLGDDWERTYK